MGKMQRDKGNRVERWFVNTLKAAGVDCHKVPLSGAIEGYGGDIIVKIPICDQSTEIGVEEKRIEVKARKNGEGFATIERWLEGSDFLFLKRDRAKPLVVMTWEEYLRLIT